MYSTTATNEVLLRAVVALDVHGVTECLRMGAKRTFAPLPLGKNALHMVLSIVPQSSSELTRIIQITKVLLLNSSSGYVNSTTKSHCTRAGGVTPLMMCVTNRRLELARVLLTMSPDVHAVDNEEHLTCLMMAARAGDATMVRLLMSNRAASTLSYRSKFGKTALMYACSAAGQPDSVGAMNQSSSSSPRKKTRSKTKGDQSRRDPTMRRISSDPNSGGDSSSDSGDEEADDMLDDAFNEDDVSVGGMSSDDDDHAWKPREESVSRATRVVKALIDGLQPMELLDLLMQRDCDGWTPLHFAAKSGVLTHVPWRRLLGDKLIHRAGVGALTAGSLSVLHLAAWNGQTPSIVTVLHHMDGYAPGYSPWANAVEKNLLAMDHQFSAADLALAHNDHGSASYLFGAGCHAHAHAGEKCDEALERALLEFDVAAMEALLRAPQNKISLERHAIQLVQLIKYEDSCTFTFAGYNNPIQQHMYMCTQCNKQVCLVCAQTCHQHENDDGSPTKQPERLGFQESATWCACPRHSCLCVPEEEARLYQFIPNPLDTSKVTIAVNGSEIIAANLHRASIVSVMSKRSLGSRRSRRSRLSISKRTYRRATAVGSFATHGRHSSSDALSTGSSANRNSAAAGVGHGSNGSPRAGLGKSGGQGNTSGLIATIFAAPSTELDDLPNKLKRLVDVMAKQAHTVWALTKALAGWHHGEKRNDEAKLHPLLLPYDKLPNDAQDSNRRDALKILKLIKAIGYNIKLIEADPREVFAKAAASGSG